MRLLFVALAACIFGCGPTRAARNDLQPVVAAFGAYSVMAVKSPAPQPADGCTKGCKCNGTGQEKSGDGISIVACRCPETCSCKKKAAKACPSGTCQWPTRNITP